MRWIAFIIAGWVVVTFIVGALIGHLITRHPQVESDRQRTGAGDGSSTGDERAKRPA